MDVNAKRMKTIFFASVAMDLVAVAIVITLVNPWVGLLVAACLFAAEYVMYWVLFRPGILREKLLTGDIALGGSQGDTALEGAAEEKRREASEMVNGWEAVNDAIRESGLPAEATVLKAWELGVNVNGKNPAMQFLLEVRPAEAKAFQAQATCVVAEASFSKFQPGNVIQVKYDPDDLTRVAVVHS